VSKCSNIESKTLEAALAHRLLRLVFNCNNAESMVQKGMVARAAERFWRRLVEVLEETRKALLTILALLAAQFCCKFILPQLGYLINHFV